ncbi:MAG: ArsR/SmtB family transcription factor [Bacillota bacterium]
MDKSSDKSFENLEKLLKVIAVSTRLKILSRIKQEEVCACDLLTCLNVSQPTLSHHLKVLREHGLVKNRQVGTRTLYTLEDNAIENIHALLDRLMDIEITC